MVRSPGRGTLVSDLADIGCLCGLPLKSLVPTELSFGYQRTEDLALCGAKLVDQVR